MASKTLKELAEYVGGRVVGDDSVVINGASTLGRAGEGEISFLANIRYRPQLKTTKASAVIVKEEADVNVPLIIIDDPYYAFMQIMVLLHGHRKHKEVGVSSRASISDTAKIGADCHIHRFVTISDDVKIGDGCIIYPGVFVGEGVRMGSGCIIYPNVVIYDGTKIGDNVIINAGSAVGQDGFGFATHNGEHHKIPQVGIVVLEDNVELGANCAIERGTLGDTVISKGTKIGDIATIGHGTKIGEHCLIVAQVGIAGSATLGDYCVIGGQVGIIGHITVGNRVMVGAQAGIINSVPDDTIMLGSPAIEASKGKRAYSLIEHLPTLRKDVRKLKKDFEKLSEKAGGEKE